MIFAIIALHLKVYSFDGVDDSLHLFPPFTLQSHFVKARLPVRP